VLAHPSPRGAVECCCSSSMQISPLRSSHSDSTSRSLWPPVSATVPLHTGPVPFHASFPALPSSERPGSSERPARTEEHPVRVLCGRHRQLRGVEKLTWGDCVVTAPLRAVSLEFQREKAKELTKFFKQQAANKMVNDAAYVRAHRTRERVNCPRTS
jgi:hypothetical protein